MNIICLTKDYEATCSNEDYIYLFLGNWYAQEIKNNVYAVKRIGRKTIYMHQEVIQRMGLVIPEGHVIDHKDRNGLNNNRDNLRIVTHSINHHNLKLYSNNKSGVKGVFYYKRKRKWIVNIEVNKLSIHLGYFDIFEDAVAARLQAEIKYAKEIGNS